jgi:hypothetical protein
MASTATERNIEEHERVKRDMDEVGAIFKLARPLQRLR